jgi:hypothetical protein
VTQDTPKNSIFSRLDTDLLRETGKASRAIPPEKVNDEPKEKNAPQKIERPKPSISYKPNKILVKSNNSIRQKFTSVIRPDYKRRLRRLAFDRDCDPCDILEEALTLYFAGLDKKN